MEKFNKWYLILLILLYISFLKVEDLSQVHLHSMLDVISLLS